MDDSLKQGPVFDTGMKFLVKSFSDITLLETTHHLPLIYVYECFILWNSRTLVLKGKGKKEKGTGLCEVPALCWVSCLCALSVVMWSFSQQSFIAGSITTDI